MRFTLIIQTERSDFALSPRQLAKPLRELAKKLGTQSDYEAASIHGYEGRVRDAEGNTIGKWEWSTGNGERT